MMDENVMLKKENILLRRNTEEQSRILQKAQNYSAQIDVYKACFRHYKYDGGQSNSSRYRHNSNYDNQNNSSRTATVMASRQCWGGHQIPAICTKWNTENLWGTAVGGLCLNTRRCGKPGAQLVQNGASEIKEARKELQWRRLKY